MDITIPKLTAHLYNAGSADDIKVIIDAESYHALNKRRYSGLDLFCFSRDSGYYLNAYSGCYLNLYSGFCKLFI